MNNYNTIVITGASSGIGASIAKKFSLNGATVFALARNTKKLNEVRRTLPKNAQTNFIPKKCDVTNPKEVDKVFGGIFSKHRIDMVISNAGLGYSKPFIKHSENDIKDILITNINGTLNVTKACLKNRGKKRLQMVYTSSLAGKVGFPDMSIYSASKFAIEGFAESLRGEYENKEVAFTVLRPGITRTPFFKKAGMEKFEISVKDLKNCYSPEKVAEMFYDKISPSVKTIIVGNDKYFLALLPFTPFKYRFKVLDFTNKL